MTSTIGPVNCEPSISGKAKTVLPTTGTSRAPLRRFSRSSEKKEYLAGLSADVFSARAAYYFGELNALHPFREGNGRTQREFISHLAQASGFYIAWENVSQADMLAAAVQSFHGDISKLTTLIRDNLSGL